MREGGSSEREISASSAPRGPRSRFGPPSSPGLPPLSLRALASSDVLWAFGGAPERRYRPPPSDPPEILKCEEYGEKVGVFSFGLLM